MAEAVLLAGAQSLTLLSRIQLNDRHAWDALRPGQFVVFLSDPQAGTVLDYDGKLAGEITSIPVFESLAEAEHCAAQLVARLPTVCASIYDHRGRGGEPLRVVYHDSIRSRFDPARRARRDSWIGGSLLGAFAIWAIIAAFRSEEHFLWFYIVGVKLLTLGTILFVRGMGYFLGRRRG